MAKVQVQELVQEQVLEQVQDLDMVKVLVQD